ncbi:MAG TPA: choice-of-anchor D domain-containing protein [Myxococcota bacterium]|nr:choice-of-anchor D domain-containing protein [Myxococcota bacterium]
MRQVSKLFTTAVVACAMMLTCGCDDDRGLQESAPRAGSFFVGSNDTAPGLDEFDTTPESSAIEIDFGLVDVSSVAKRYLFVRNTGRSKLLLTAIQMDSGSSPDFVVACLSGGVFVSPCPASTAKPSEIAPGSDLQIEISYAPIEVGSDTGGFSLTCNAVDHQTITVALSGQGVTPEIQVCASDCTGDQQGAQCTAAAEICNDDTAPDDLSVDFGDLELSASVRREVTIRNNGDQELQINNLAITGGDFNQFSLDLNGNSLPGGLSAGGQVTIFISYEPKSGGTHLSALAIRSNDVNENVIQVSLNGRGMAPRLCPEPLALDFGNVPTGETGEMSFKISNCGLLDIDLTNVALSPDPPDPEFSLLSLPTFTKTLTPGESLDINVQYHPTDSGSDHGGVDLFSNDPASDPGSGLTGTIALYGESIPRECDLQATPFVVNFGGVVQDTAQTVELIISNQGTDSCTIENVAITTNSEDNEFAILQAPPANEVIDPGDTRVVEMEYHPINLGADHGLLVIYGNDKDGHELPVDLNGEGVETAECDVVIQPAPFVNFGLVKLYNTKAMSVTISNQGLATCHLQNAEVELVPIFGQDFSLTAHPPFPATLGPRGQPNSSAEVEVTFAPQREWGQFAIMRIYVDDPDLGDLACTDDTTGNPIPGQACLNLTATSKESELEIVPAELDFGVVTVGCNSPTMCVNVYNLGTVNISIDDIALDNPADPNFEITQAPMTSFNLAGAASFQVCLRYHPQDTNPHRATLIIKADGDEEHTVPLFGRGTDISDQSDIFYQPSQVRSDVLFVVDCSGSMGDDQQNLADNFGAFINWAINLDVDFHLGVVATDVDNMNAWSGTPPRQITSGILVNTDSTPKIITSQTPDFIGRFQDNVRLGDSCSNHEAGLEGAWIALSEPFVSDPEANLGFLREDAKLYIIILSDEPDQSKGEPDFYVDFFKSIKGYRNTEMMAVSAICADEPPNGRYYYITQETGGIFESINTADWNTTLEALGFDAFAAIREFPLSRPADAGSLTVTINDNPVPQASSEGGADGWTYYPDTNTIYFGDDYVPDKGDKIEVDYSATCI